MTISNDALSVITADRRSITVTGLFNEETRLFELKPMFVSSQPPTTILDREEAIRKRAHFAAQADEFRQEAEYYWKIAEREFDTHTLYVVVSNYVYGDQEFMVPMDIVCREGASWDATYIFGGNIPYVSRVDAIDFYREGQHLHHFDVPQAIPDVVLNWRTGEEPLSGKMIVMWQGQHEEGRKLYYYLTYESLDGKRVPLTALSEASEVEVDFSTLPSGVGQLKLTSSDGYNTVETRSPRFYVPRRPCTALIFSPEDRAVLPGGQVDLSGRGLYDDGMTEEVEALEWVSDRDGSLGRGALITGVVLTPGRHRISLVAGLPGAEGSSSVRVESRPRDS